MGGTVLSREAHVPCSPNGTEGRPTSPGRGGQRGLCPPLDGPCALEQLQAHSTVKQRMWSPQRPPHMASCTADIPVLMAKPWAQ